MKILWKGNRTNDRAIAETTEGEVGKSEKLGVEEKPGALLYPRGVLEAAGIVTALWLTLFLAWYLAHALLLVFAGVLTGVFLTGTANWLSGRAGISRGWSLTAVVCSLAVIGGLGFWLLIPNVADQIGELLQELPRSIDHAKDRLTQYAWAQPVFQQLPDTENLMGNVGGFLRNAAGFLSTTLGVLSSLVVILFFGLYLAADPQLYQKGLIRLVPVHGRERAAQILHAMGFTLHWWLIGRLIDMALVGLLTWIGLWLLEIPLALTLAVIAALLTFIPNIGPILSAIPAVLLGLQQGQAQALYVLLLYLGIQTVETYFITPLIHKRMGSLPPVLTFFAQISMGILLGIPGLILATPLAAAMLVLVKMIYIEDLLGDRIEVHGKEAGRVSRPH